MDDIIQAIKAKKELGNLDDSFVREKIEKIFRSDNRIVRKYEESRDFAQFSRSKEYDTLLKSVRKELRTVYGVFQEADREGLLVKGDIDGILESHTSTRERLPYYDEVYKKLSTLIPAPRKILDLGCGMNPLSYKYMVKHGWTPYIIASDISTADMDFIRKCFSVLGYPGMSFQMDLIKDYEKLEEIEVDIVFMLKLLDSLEEAQRHIAYKIMKHVRANWVVVSFPTKSLGGRKSISTAGRTWFERLMERYELKFVTFSIENELFYVISH